MPGDTWGPGPPVLAHWATGSGTGAPGMAVGTKRWKELETPCRRQDWRKHGSDLPRFKDAVKSRERSCLCIYGGEDKKMALNCRERDSGWT